MDHTKWFVGVQTKAEAVHSMNSTPAAITVRKLQF